MLLLLLFLGSNVAAAPMVNVCLPRACHSEIGCQVSGIITSDASVNEKLVPLCKQVAIAYGNSRYCWNEVRAILNSERVALFGEGELKYGDAPEISAKWGTPYKISDLRTYLNFTSNCELLQRTIWSQKTVEITNTVSQFSSGMDFRTNLEIAQDLISSHGPVTDQERGVYLKGWYQGTSSDEFVTWAVVKHHGSEQNFRTKVNPTHTCADLGTDYRKTKFFTIVEAHQRMREEGCICNYNNSKIHVNKLDLVRICSERHHFVKVTKLFTEEQKPAHPSMRYIVCVNGTVMEEGENTHSDIPDCEQFTTVIGYQQCKQQGAYDKCTVKTEDGQDKSKVTVNLGKPGSIQVKTSEYMEKVDCDPVCTLFFSSIKDVIITCPEGTKHFLREHSDETEECPFISYSFPGKISGYVCRATYHPSLFYFFLFFLVLGKKLVNLLYLIIDFCFCIIMKCCHKVAKNINPGNQYCFYCSEYIPYSDLVSKHDSCEAGICPYCRASVGSRIVKHTPTCKDRSEILYEYETKSVGTVSIKRVYERFWASRTRRVLCSSTYVLTCLILLIVIVSPSSAVDLDNQVADFEGLKDPFAVYQQEFEECNPNCLHELDSCHCSTRRQKRSANLQSIKKRAYPVGFFNPRDTFSITQNSKDMELTWSSVTETGSKVVVSGNSIAELRLEVDTGITWTISNTDAAEKITISVGIHDYSQIYETEFVSFTSDRTVKTGTDNSCTGTCKSDCGCEDPTCNIFKREGNRNWRCNPSWCWKVGGGCDCCWLRAILEHPKYLFAEFRTKYLKTRFVVCIKVGKDRNTCKVMDDDGVFTIDKITLKISGARNVDEKIPEKIYLIYDLKNSGFDLKHPDEILLNPDICTFSTCKHGQVGDYRFQTVSHIMFPQEKAGEHVTMVWTGVQQDISCQSFHWPVCNAFGAVSRNTDQFKNILEVSTKVSSSFQVQHLETSLVKDSFSVSLAARPKRTVGHVSLFMSASGLELRRKEDKPFILNSFVIKECVGCRGCLDGFNCTIEISSKNKNAMNIHFISHDSLYLVESNSFIVEMKPKTTVIHGFSSVPLEKIVICIEESGNCSTSSNVLLSEPKKRLVTKSIIISSQEADSNGWSVTSIFGSVTNFAMTLGRGIWNTFGTISSIIPLIFLSLIGFLIIRFGFKIFFTFIPSRTTRGFYKGKLA